MISDEARSMLHSLQESPVFRAALAELIEDQRRLCIETMRGHVQVGEIGRAQQAEGALRAYEDLPGIFANYAKQYKPHRV